MSHNARRLAVQRADNDNAMMQYRLHTLLILLAVLPPVIWKTWLARGALGEAAQRASAEDWLCLLVLSIGMFVVVRAVAPYLAAADIALQHRRGR